ncbi:MAG TPA: hypothetical protein VN635_04685 [Conexibacter sp.]|nr:hypothetical protein [Conexibacter sp.]
MHRRIAIAIAPLAVALAAALPASAAEAPRIVLAPGCYLSSATGLLTGSGFTPNATWTAKLSGTKQIGTGRIDARGRIRARFTAPRYHGTVGTRTLTLSVTDGPHVASTTFQLTPLTASFSPRDGDPKTLRVRWRVLGLGPDHGVYIHYVAPNGKLKTTLRIGTAQGACGTLKTGPIALFPFRYTYGTWTLQVDASRRYSTRTTPRLLIGFEIRRPRKSRTR